MGLRSVFDPPFIPPLHLETEPPLASDVFLIVLNPTSSIEHVYRWCLAYLNQFSQADQVTLLIQVDPLLSAHLLDELVSRLEKLNLADNAPDLVVWSDEIGPEEEPALFARCLAYLDCSLADVTSLPLLKAIFMNKQVVCFKHTGTQKWLNSSVAYFLDAVEDTEAVYRQALFELYHRLLKQYPRNEALEKVSLQQCQPPPFDYLMNLRTMNYSDFEAAVRDYYQQGFTREAAMLILNWAQNHPLGPPLMIESPIWMEILLKSRYYSALISIVQYQIAQNPEKSFLLLGDIYLDEGDLESAVQNYHKVLTLNPFQENAKAGFDKANYKLKQRSKIPPIFINGLGNSASEYISLVLSRGLNIPRMSISSGSGVFEMVVDYYSLEKLAQGGMIAKDHFHATDANLYALTRFLDKMVLGLRDPRGSLVSGVVYDSYLSRKQKNNQEDTGFLGQALFSDLSSSVDESISLNFHQKCDRDIENGKFEVYIKNTIEWLDFSDYFPVYVYSFESFKKDERAVISEILNFYQINPDDFQFPFTEADRQGSLFSSSPNLASPNYTLRRGNPYEWYRVLTPEQIKKTSTMIPRWLCRKMGWLEI